MKRVIWNFLIIASVITSLTQSNLGQSKITPADTRTDTAEIEKVVRDYYDAWARLDEAAVLSLHGQDGFYYSLRNGFEKFAGAMQQFRDYFKMPKSEQPRFTYQIDDLKIVPAGADTAIANYKIITKMTGGGLDRTFEERYTNVFNKQGGKWKLVAEHSSDLPKAVAETIEGMPLGWIRTPAGNADRYSMKVDPSLKHGGNAGATVKFICGDPEGFGSLAQSIAADDYLGKRLRLSGWLKTENASDAGLWMRLDGERRTLGFDNMMPRAVKGTTDWKRYEVVLDVPQETVNILFGTLLSGKGQVWVDDMKLEVVGNDVATTNQLSQEAMRSENPNRVVKKSASKQPVNLGFENGPQP